MAKKITVKEAAKEPAVSAPVPVVEEKKMGVVNEAVTTPTPTLTEVAMPVEEPASSKKEERKAARQERREKRLSRREEKIALRELQKERTAKPIIEQFDSISVGSARGLVQNTPRRFARDRRKEKLERRERMKVVVDGQEQRVSPASKYMLDMLISEE